MNLPGLPWVEFEVEVGVTELGQRPDLSTVWYFIIVANHSYNGRVVDKFDEGVGAVDVNAVMGVQ